MPRLAAIYFHHMHDPAGQKIQASVFSPIPNRFDLRFIVHAVTDKCRSFLILRDDRLEFWLNNSDVMVSKYFFSSR